MDEGMKANEAPEKIYLEREKETNRIHHLWGRTPVVSSLYEHIEYTNTGAFIEKAFEFFSEHLCEYIDVKNANCDTFIEIDDDKLKEDFKNYIKGE
jgi:hypothetical protein